MVIWSVCLSVGHKPIQKDWTCHVFKILFQFIDRTQWSISDWATL